MTDDLATLLERVPGWAGRARVVGALDGGITNRNILVEVDGNRFVLRLPGKDTQLLGIDREVERFAAERAASLGFAPRVAGFVEPEQCLITHLVPGEGIPLEEMGSQSVLSRTAPILRKFHESGDLPGRFDCFRVPEQSARHARTLGVTIPAAFDIAMERAREIEAAFAASFEPRVPCHNDLLNANFLRDRSGRVEQIWLLDWEYAGMNDRYFDLGNYAVNNELDEGAAEHFVAAYFGTVTRRRLARLWLMRIMSDLREAMWGVVQQGISQLDFDYVAYADMHFARLLAHASASGYQDALDAAATPE